MGELALITGGAGFIGLHLARALADRETQVVLVDDLSRGHADRELERLMRNRDVRLVEHDLTRPLANRLDGLRPDLVFHLAGIVGVRRVDSQPERALINNVLALHNVFDWMARTSPRAFFFSSTSEVADGAVRLGLAELPMSEEVPFVCPRLSAPRASYSMSKAYCEMLALRLGERREVAVRIARYFNVYGPRMGHAHVIPELIGRVLAGQAPLEVYGADATRSFCYVSDAVRATLALMETPDPEPIVANIGNDREQIVIRELAREILRLAGSDAELAERPPPGDSPTDRRPDISRLRALTGYEPAVNLADGISRTFAWHAATSNR